MGVRINAYSLAHEHVMLQGAAVFRDRVFILADGTFVVQLDEHRVQELMTGLFRPYNPKLDYSHPITDYQLAQLRISGRVERYNKHYVWLNTLPEAGQLGWRRVLAETPQQRLYYISTPYPRAYLAEVQAKLEKHNLAGEYTAKIAKHTETVVILGRSGAPFPTLDDAEQAHHAIIERANRTLHNLGVAHIDKVASVSSMDNVNNIDGKLIVLALPQEDERQAFGGLLADMHLEVKEAATAEEALHLLEDHAVHLFIMDIQMPDMHGWQMLRKVREISELREIPILVIANQPNLGNTVAKVDYLTRPVSIARLRQNVTVALSQNS